ncbi:hypothetical protein [Sphingomonas xinjiangensis]|uniref:Uncharacterized protein n=1 Tax=Sphingomonas xinjiangensis TaxID=643568 RepID=A0A840YRF9_9SPHN|nr:hypothetical protein [Sphingomonas xinjiangensis]
MAAEAPVETREEAEPRRRTRRPRRDEATPADTGEGLDLAVLPPALGDAASAEVSEEAPKKPRRRRTVRTEDAEVPAA